MAAAYLNRTLSDVRITLIESSKTPRIGVGEATLPSLSSFMKRLGFTSPRSWLGACEGTIKTGILFEDWYEKGEQYVHPFEALDYLDEHYHIGHYWLAEYSRAVSPQNLRDSFNQTVYLTKRLNVDRNSAPVNNSFAYHINADLFGRFLEHASPDVHHIVDEVVDVVLAEDGYIESLKTIEHGIISADLYIDCTGFRRQLMRYVNQKLRYISYQSSLFCDRAVVLRFPYQSEETREIEMHPYSRAVAGTAGWCWTIPLYNRISSGYVYSSSFQREDDAWEELRAHWGEEQLKQAVPWSVKFESGKLDNLWQQNCVAIGLAGSFIEPLESTGLGLAQAGIELLASVLDARAYNTFTVERYNTYMQRRCEDVLHFVVAHYCLTNREETEFWKSIKYETHIPDELSARLDTFKRLLPSVSTRGLHEPWFFRDLSWFAVLLGMNFRFDIPDLSASQMEKGRDIVRKKNSLAKKLSEELTGHLTFLASEVYSSVRTNGHGCRDEEMIPASVVF